jgi:protein tyrosine phosphatase
MGLSIERSPLPRSDIQPVTNQQPDRKRIFKIISIASLAFALLSTLLLFTTLPIYLVVSMISLGIITSLFFLILSRPPEHVYKEVTWEALEKATKKDQSYQTEVNHRFTDICCPQDTAISVGGKFIHANKVGQGLTERRFIATQAPLEADREIFWKAIFEDQATIIDLTTPKDPGIVPYYPTEPFGSMIFGSMKVTLIGVGSGDQKPYSVVNTSDGTARLIVRHHFSRWPDFGAISLKELNRLVEEILTEKPPKGRDTIWVHCRAGVGRTGTLITALILKEKFDRGELTSKNASAVLSETILKLREQRGPSFVQQPVQLKLLNEFANALFS